MTEVFKSLSADDLKMYATKCRNEMKGNLELIDFLTSIQMCVIYWQYALL